ncbi:hypothetical protein GHT06_019548 [Daphnia sinensis]|uniref:Ankyrin repeat domain-containing protein 54 n=1 Tax=Daphnia sinensis TaxID=1820382 RepID=A0AAD5L1I5_9CRUS|nr:hypothetical protein GHT06_019548 [Daphnia sinensis]
MDSRTPVRYVWRYMLRRVWQYTSRGMRKVWRKVWRRVPETADTSPAVRNGWDTQSITYSDCEAFFEAVSKGSKKKLNIMLFETNGPEVTAELAKSYNEDGETPLLMATRQGKKKMVKFLLQQLHVPVSQHGRFTWNGVEYPEVPPLFVAILCGQTDIVPQLVAAEIKSGQTLNSINSIVYSTNDRHQKINILELLGAANLCFYDLHGSRELGLLYWKEAMNLRNATNDGWQVIPKPEVPFASDVARKAMGFAFEFTTLEQLDQIIASDLQLFTQNVLVSQRIVNTISPGANLFNLAHLCHFVGMCYNEEEQYDRTICIGLFFLEYFQQHQWEDSEACVIASCVLDYMTKSFKKLRPRPPDSREEFTFANLMVVFEFASAYVTGLQDDERTSGTSYDIARNILKIVLLIVEMLPQLDAHESRHFKRCLYHFLRSDQRWGLDRQNLLHMICRCEDPFQYLNRPHNWDYESDEDDSEDDYDSDVEDDDDDVSDDDDDSDDDSDSSSCANDDDDTDGSASGCSSCGHRADDGGPNDDDNDFEEIGFENEIEEEQFVEIPSKELQLAVIKLLLELGADPNATDAKGLTPLHLLAMHSKDFDQAQVMMDYGGHIDQADNNRLTPLIHFGEWHRDLVLDGMPDPRLQALIHAVLPLSCLAAQVLRQNEIPFVLNEIPATLHSFVYRH